MECRNVDSLMDAFLDGELDAPAAQELNAHLAACVRCRREWGGLVQLLSNPAPVDVPQGLRDRIVAAVDLAAANSTLAERNRGWWQVRLTRLRSAAAIAACVLFFVAGWRLSGWWSTPQPEIVVQPDIQPSPQPTTVVVSPWIISSMAQAAAMPAPVSPAVMLARGALPELTVKTARLPLPGQAAEAVEYELSVDELVEQARSSRIHNPSRSSATQPADSSELNDLQIIPFVPRYPGV